MYKDDLNILTVKQSILYKTLHCHYIMFTVTKYINNIILQRKEENININNICLRTYISDGIYH